MIAGSNHGMPVFGIIAELGLYPQGAETGKCGDYGCAEGQNPGKVICRKVCNLS